MGNIYPSPQKLQVPNKKYQCDHCEFTTHWLPYFAKHMEKKHGGKEFVAPDPLLSEKYKKYKCEECDFFTHYIPYLNKHKAGRYTALFHS